MIRKNNLIRLSLSVMFLVTISFYSQNILAQTSPTIDEVKTGLHKYLKAFTAKKQRMPIHNVKYVLRFVKTNPKVAITMYLSYKRQWDKRLGWQETKSQKHLRELQKKLYYAKKNSMPKDSKSFKKYDHSWRTIEGDAAYHLNTFCKKTKDKTCYPAKIIRTQAAATVIKGWKHGLKTPAIEFDALQDLIIDGEREKIYSSHMQLDKWIPQLANEKTIYWKSFLKKQGGLKKWAKKEDLVKCVPLKKKGRRKLKNSLLKYVYKSKDKVTIRCEFLKPPRKWKKYKKKPYWKVSIRWAGRWEPLLTYKVKRPSRKSLVHWKWKASELNKIIKKKSKATKFNYPGKWARVQVEYIYPWILKYVWKGRVKVPVWRYSSKAATSFFVKWKK
jgi:hypothetical protein